MAEDLGEQAGDLMGADDDKYLLVDGNNLLSRADHAARAGATGLASHGVSTGALYYFINSLARYVRLVGPTHVSVYWDAGHDFRDRIYPRYKANRERPIGVDGPPFAQTKTFLSWANVPHRSRPGWEADDLIAFTARYTRGQKVILSGDRDLLQLLGPHTIQYDPNDKSDTPWTPERFEEKYGYPPHQEPYLKALRGDTGDGVPGLKGIGPKKAEKMMAGVGWDWDALLASLPEEQREEVKVFRELVDLRYLDYESKGFSIFNCPSCMAFKPTGPQDMLWGPLRDFLASLEMVTIIERLQTGALWTPDSDLVAQLDQTAGVFETMDG